MAKRRHVEGPMDGPQARDLWGLPLGGRPIDAGDLDDDDAAALDRLAAVLPALTCEFDPPLVDAERVSVPTPGARLVVDPADWPPPRGPAAALPLPRRRRRFGWRVIRWLVALALVYTLVTAAALAVIRFIPQGRPAVVVGPPACPFYWADVPADGADASRSGCFFVG